MAEPTPLGQRGLRLREALAPLHGDGLRTLLAYGRGLADPRVPLHVLVVLDDASAATLALTAGPVSVLARAGLEPLFLGAAELPRATDCYALEFVLMQAHYEVLHGADCLAALVVPRTAVRPQLAEALCTARHWLRQEAARRGQVARNLVPLLANSLSGLDRVWSGLVWLLGEDAAPSPTAWQRAVGQRWGLDAALLRRLQDLAQGAWVPAGQAAYTALAEYDALLSALLARVDSLPD